LHPNVGAKSPALTRRGRKTSAHLHHPPLSPRTPTNCWAARANADDLIQEWQYPSLRYRRRMTMDFASACAALHNVSSSSHAVCCSRRVISTISDVETSAQLQHFLKKSAQNCSPAQSLHRMKCCNIFSSLITNSLAKFPLRSTIATLKCSPLTFALLRNHLSQRIQVQEAENDTIY
jgi:hypothetical protein